MMSVPQVRLDEALVDEISHAMDLRDPNRLALKTLVARLGAWQEATEDDEMAEFVLDVATGVGKTYVMGAAIDYLAEFGVRDFVVFVPRTAILNKTLNNFTHGHPKSIVDYMQTDPTVVTIDDLESPATRVLMDDPSELKVYVVTVQSFTGRIAQDVQRRAHTFQEALGENFYKHLQSMDDLVVFADEHHTYYGPAFSSAVRDLRPIALFGLTGTPHDKTPDEQIIYRYPLANAIADRYVKRPVIVGRGDELSDDRTKLLDGAALLRAKQQAADTFAEQAGEGRRNLLMLVVAQDIAEAEKAEGILTDPAFFDGYYADKVLRVDSNQPDEALEALDRVEDPDSPYRIIVSVAMLKEGWDVATVSVICSLRASVSELLTEQTLGRGLRLPWGRYIDDPLLNELDVVAHEQYEKVLAKAGVLAERLVDWRTWQAQQREAAEELAKRAASDKAIDEIRRQFAPLETARVTAAPDPSDQGGDKPEVEPDETFELRAVVYGDRQAEVSSEGRRALTPDTTLGTVRIPVVKTQDVTSSYGLSEVLAQGRKDFVDLGKRFARDPEDTLRRQAVVATVQLGLDGIPRTSVRTVPAETSIESEAKPPTLEESRERLVAAIMHSDYSTSRIDDRGAAEAIVDALIEGAGDKADTIGAYLDQIAGALLRTVGGAVSELASKPNVQQVVAAKEIDWRRNPAEAWTDDLRGEFDKTKGYRGWTKSLYEEARFHSSTERDCALILDEGSNGIQFWARLHRNDLGVNWLGAGRQRTYNPDFLVVEMPKSTPKGRVRKCWLVEVKSDTHFWDGDVVEKHDAASRWASRVTNDPSTEGYVWDVLRVKESHIADAKGSWSALQQLGETALS